MQKCSKPFSAIALDQGHEQNNAIIKDVGGAVGLLTPDMDSALRRWEVAGPEVSRLLNEYENQNKIVDKEHMDEKKHHEDYPGFLKLFLRDVNKLYMSFRDISNPFAEEQLQCLHNGRVMGTEIQESLGNLLVQNERRYQEFCLHWLQLCDIAVSEKISNYNLWLPSSLDDDQTKNNQTQKNKTELKTAKLLQAASPYRETLVKECVN